MFRAAPAIASGMYGRQPRCWFEVVPLGGQSASGVDPSRVECPSCGAWMEQMPRAMRKCLSLINVYDGF